MICHLQVGDPGKLVVCKAQEAEVSVSESRRRRASQLKPRADLPSIFFSLKQSFFFLNYLFLAALGFFRCDEQGLFSTYGAQASLVAERRLQVLGLRELWLLGFRGQAR